MNGVALAAAVALIAVPPPPPAPPPGPKRPPLPIVLADPRPAADRARPSPRTVH